MSFLMRIEWERPDGRVVDDQSLVIEESTLAQLEMGVHLRAGDAKLRITFDPPLVAGIAPLAEEGPG